MNGLMSIQCKLSCVYSGQC